MAPRPNRNDLNTSLHSLKSIDLGEHFTTTSKYPPLIPPALSSEEAKVAVSCATIESNLVEAAKSLRGSSPQQNETQDTVDYWHMPADQDKDYFSSSHLEKMLVQDAELRSVKKEASTRRRTQGPTVSYWDWSEPKEEVPPSKNALVEMILKHESIRQMMTCESIAKHEAQHHQSKSPAPQIKPKHCNSMHDSESYFYYPPYEEEKQTIINRIIQEEDQRQVLLTENIVENLVSQRKAFEETKIEPITTQDSYWNW